MRVRHTLFATLLALPGLAFAQGTGGSSYEPGTMQPEPGSEARTSMPSAQEPQVDVFKNKDNWEIRGTVSSVDSSNNQVTLQRENNLPPVQLHVAQGTEIKMDGQTSSLSQLQPGSEVRARFNLANDQPVAISLEAKKSKAEKKSQRESEKMQREMNR